MRVAFFITLAVLACAGQGNPEDDIASALARTEYFPSGDGWAEARRRRMVTRYLESAGFHVTALQHAPGDGRLESKYRQVSLLAQRSGEQAEKKRTTVTLALLVPETQAAAGDFAARQRACDSVLLALLREQAQFSRVELVTSAVCFGLTAQRAAQK